jgi:1-acyl-sn-glycerol-3-phosphate acyltransferase
MSADHATTSAAAGPPAAGAVEDRTPRRSGEADLTDPSAAMVPGARSAVRLALRPVLRSWLRLRVEGLDHLPADGAVIVASTHQSHADSVALGVAIRRPMFFLGDRRLTAMPVLGPLLPKLGMVSLRRGEADVAAMDAMRALLHDERCIAVYPEGSRSRDGLVHRLRSGVARLAAETGVPVVPAAVAGIHAVWPIGTRPRLRGGRVTVRFGPAIAAPADDPRSRRVFNDHLRHTLAELAGVEVADDFSPIGGGA